MRNTSTGWNHPSPIAPGKKDEKTPEGPEHIRSGPSGVSLVLVSQPMENIKGFSRLERFPDLLAQAAIQERHDLGAGAVVVGTEGGGGGTGGNTVLSSPQNCVGVVSVSRHVGEGIHAVGGGRLLTAPQEGDDLRTGAGGIGAEGGGSCAGGDALAHGPDHGVGVVSIVSHIRERIFAVLFRPLGISIPAVPLSE